ncbi:TIGR04002 family protein [uncultured Ruminococcus sp.]|uniref:TIGR04002 family protein n=1 Tax=uncultured Ruminococcus sp. TaxID=165186 RepID=UPI0025D387D8|nr:TIGR04002 family protein [uncultured Ruminococcus sp.]
MTQTKTINNVKAKNIDHKKLQNLALSGLFAALIYLLTAFVRVPTGAGYTHAGDSAVFLAACILPTPYAAAAAAVGGAMADGLSGFAIWIPATVIIKAVTSLFFTSRKGKIICLRNIIALIPSLALCIVGYSLYQGIFMTDGFSSATIAAAFGQTPAYCVQIAVGSGIYLAVGSLLDKTGLFKFIMHNAI